MANLKHATDFYKMVPKGPIANLVFRQEIMRRVTVDPEYASRVRAICRGDPFVYFSAFCFTVNPARPHPRKKVPFLLYSFQETGMDMIFDSLEEGFDISVEKSRQMGASWLFALAIHYCWRFRQGQNFLMLSRSDEYVDKSNEPKSLFYKLDFINNNLPKWLLPVGWDPKKHRFVKRMLNPENGNTIVGEATTEDSGRGGTFTAVLHDEFGACDVGMGILKSTRAATSTRWFNSTPKGTGNAHYRIVQLSRQNPQQVRPMRFHWSQHPEYSEGIYKLDKEGKPQPFRKTRKGELDSYIEENADLIQSLKKRGFWDEYTTRSRWFDIQCSRATTKAEISQEVEIDYGGAGYQFFDSRDIHELINLYCSPPKYKGDIEFDFETLEPEEFREHGHGGLELWCELIHGAPPARPYVMGVDAAAGTGASNSVLSIWDAKSCEKVGQYVDPNIKPERLAKLAIAICKWFWDAYMIWETNGSGRAFGDAVIEWGFGRYYKRPGNVETGESAARAGWAPTRDNKYQLLSQYRGALTDRTVCNRCEQAMAECLEYLFLGNNWVEHSSLNENEDPSGARDQHGDRCFIEGTMIAAQYGELHIELIDKGDLVWTRDGLRQVVECGRTGTTEVFKAVLSNGRSLIGTANHPVWTENRAWVPLSLLTPRDRLVDLRFHHKHGEKPWVSITGEPTDAGQTPKRSYSTDASTTGTLTRIRSTGSDISGVAENRATGTRSRCTLQFGSIITGLRRKVWSFITKTTTRLTTISQTWSASPIHSTARFTTPEEISKRPGIPRCTDIPASGVETNTRRFGSGEPNSVATSAKTPVYVKSVSKLAGRIAVYNLSVADTPEYFAEGILVHNCIADALACKVMDDQPKTVMEVKREHSPLSVAGRRELVKSLAEGEKNPYVFS